ncbi:MAG: hypothetical protein H6996_12155 [Moraxellaceae bacterium]|nr:hypothetical protein [Pseudomonadales bacterium]MCP5175845.1 hypothetical protein [Moraxellaceae bacterium]MCP5177273.1 hypothetical protein [Moraxellaceae bacterium]HQV22426.1 hypothetical protein [Agitococcus sp.]
MLKKLSFILCSALLAQTSYATDVALGAGIGTLGFGVQGTFAVTPHINVRVVAQTAEVDENFEESGIDYNSTINLESYGVLADIHPFAGSFYVSAGWLAHSNGLDLKASCPTSCDIDGQSYKSAPDGQIKAAIDLGDNAPYLGIGWGNAMKDGRVYAKLDLGVLFQDDPKASLTATGTFQDVNNPLIVVNTSNNAAFQQQVANEEKDLQKELDDSGSMNLYPVINFSIGYRF